MVKQEKKRISIIFQVAALFLIGIVTTGILTYFSEKALYDNNVRRQTELHAAQIVEETQQAVREYPAYRWLIQYWYSHADTMDIEYDAQFSTLTETAEKCRLLTERHPGLQLRYLGSAEIAALPAEDQKLYAEITYSWLITRIDQIKRAYRVDYLFCVISEEPYTRQFFLFSGADPLAVRGTNYEEVYPLGNVVTVAEDQTEAMRRAVQQNSYLANAGNYLDYYAWFCSFEKHTVLIGLTYDLSALKTKIASQTRSGTEYAILNQLLLSVICLSLILVFVLRPLKKVQANIRRYERTKDSRAVTAELSQIRLHNEIGQLAADVRGMLREIDAHVEQIRSITAETERIGTELALATRIQAAMLPSVFPPFPERTEFDLYAGMDPAKEVGGDFYDFFLIDDDRLALVIADVSGKGIPAALFMMAAKILIQIWASTGLSPAKTLETVNQQVCAHNPEQMFVTVWLGILELSTGRLTAANAGHEYPALREPGGEFALYKDRHGFVVGGMDGMKYRDYELLLKPGARLFLYTDGVPEATDAAENLFGAERMLAALNQDPGASPEALLRQVRGAVDAFVGGAEQFDDLTMLCLEYRGKEPEK